MLQELFNSTSEIKINDESYNVNNQKIYDLSEFIHKFPMIDADVLTDEQIITMGNLNLSDLNYSNNATRALMILVIYANQNKLNVSASDMFKASGNELQIPHLYDALYDIYLNNLMENECEKVELYFGNTRICDAVWKDGKYRFTDFDVSNILMGSNMLHYNIQVIGFVGENFNNIECHFKGIFLDIEIRGLVLSHDPKANFIKSEGKLCIRHDNNMTINFVDYGHDQIKLELELEDYQESQEDKKEDKIEDKIIHIII